MRAHSFIATSYGQPSVQRRVVVDHAVQTVAEVDGRSLDLTVEPLLKDVGGELWQSLRLRRHDASDPMTTRELPDRHLVPPDEADPLADRVAVRTPAGEVEAVAATAPAGSWRFLVPAVESDVDAVLLLDVDGVTHEVPFRLTVQRRWQVHLVHHSHLDIGYTDPQHIVRQQHLAYLDDVLELMTATDHLPDDARFRWNEEALETVVHWLSVRPQHRREELIRRVRERRFGLSAMPFNLHTEACSTDELHELLRPAVELAQRWGLEVGAAMTTDVPGVVVGLADALAEAGVRHLAVARNWAGRSAPHTTGELDMPRLFRWRGPSGGEVTVWRTDTPQGGAYMEGNVLGLHESIGRVADLLPAYLANAARDGFPIPAEAVGGWPKDGGPTTRRPDPFETLHLRVQGTWSDNAPPNATISEIVREWNEEWAYPRLRMSVNEDFFDDATARYGDQLRTVEGDWTDWWATGLGSAVTEMAHARAAQDEVADVQTRAAMARLWGAQTPDIDAAVRRAYHQLALFDEHTWGAADSWRHQDTGPASGATQWAWKAARAYEALDEAEAAAASVDAALTAMLAAEVPRGEVVVAVLNTGGDPAAATVTFVLPDAVLRGPFRVIDARDGVELAASVAPGSSATRVLGRTVRVRVADVPPLSRVLLRIEPGEPASGVRPVPQEHVLENEHLRVSIDPRDGHVASIVVRATGRELVNADAAVGFNGYLYDRYGTVGRANHNSSRVVADPREPSLLVGRDFAGQAHLVESVDDGVERRVRVKMHGPAGQWVESTYRLAHGSDRLEITNRLAKDATPDKESGFFAFPFAMREPAVVIESAGGLSGPGAPWVPGSATYLGIVRHWVGLDDGDIAVGWGTSEVPLLQLGRVSMPYPPFPTSMGTEEPGTIYSWVFNNIWDTNFPVEQCFERDFHYAVQAGAAGSTAAGREVGAALSRPLRALVVTGTGVAAEPEPVSTALELDPAGAQLVGLVPTADGVLVRLQGTRATGTRVRMVLPAGLSRAVRAGFLGGPGTALPVGDGAVELTVPGAGVAAVLLR